MSKKLEEMRGMAVPELESQLVDLKTELAKERSLSASGTKSEKPSKMKNLRRNVARILTIIHEKKKVKKETKKAVKEKKGKRGEQA